jgi:putative pyruvate formate lyase activating enzyme
MDEVAGAARAAVGRGARTVMILGGEPTIHLPSVLELVAALPCGVRLAWKTNGHGSAAARSLLDGLFDVWVVDYKFGHDGCAKRLAGVGGYEDAVRGTLQWVRGRVDLIVRHLLMPGHVECCWRPVAAWLASELPGVKVNLRLGFWPAWHAARHAELRGPAGPAEAETALLIARENGLRLVV